MASDYAMLNIGWLVFNIVRYHSLPNGWPEGVAEFLLTAPVLLGQLLVPLLAVAVYALSGYYNQPYAKSRVDDVLNTAGVSTIAALLTFFAVLINDDIPERLLNYQLIAILWLLLALPVYAGRNLITAATKREIQEGRLRFPTIVAGTGAKARETAARIMRVPTGMQFDIIGIAGADGDFTLEQACHMARDGRVQNIVVADECADPGHIVGMFLPLGCSVYIVPDAYNLLTLRPRVSSVINEPLINITSAGMSPATANLKRAGDIVCSSIALVLLAPVMAVIAAAVKADSPGPAFYSQERVGLRGRLFRIHKFRTMRRDAEAAGPQLSSSGDTRITRVGAVLRKYRLDELPQFWNVLMGQMSLVGPRPERPHFVRLIAERAPYVSLIHQVRPGITSWGMVKFGYASSVDEMIQRLPYDLMYIENVSLGVDMRIMLHTINTVVTGKGV